jgi:hypothetical protein
MLGIIKIFVNKKNKKSMNDNLQVLERVMKAMGAKNEADLASKLGIHRGNISNYKKLGFSKKQLRIISEKTNPPLSFFEYGIMPEKKPDDVSGILNAIKFIMQTQTQINIIQYIPPVVKEYLDKIDKWEDFEEFFKTKIIGK